TWYFEQEAFANWETRPDQLPEPNIDSPGNAFWWALVTVTTVGFGEYYPTSRGGKIVASILIVFGIGLISTFTATIASVFVERKIREGKGLMKIEISDHVVICGLNSQVDEILESLNETGDISVVLVNEMEEHEFAMLREKYVNLTLKFVRGDFTKESVLRRANINHCQAILVLADRSGAHTYANADERTILGTLTMKSINSDVMVSAELLSKENMSHLERTKVEHVVVSGEFTGCLMAQSTLEPGMPQVVKELVGVGEGTALMRRLPVPSNMVGKTFQELAEYFMSNEKQILIGLITEQRKIAMDDILTDDSSFIDAFIKKTLEEAEEGLLGGKERFVPRLNPSAETVIKKTDSAVVIAGSC
ncbi:MAG: ion channel, partial [bacterium]|nr:ion channel [bacterium]